MRSAVRQELASIRELIAERDRLYNEQRRGDDQARRVAVTAMEKRLDGMNEIRGALADLSSQMVQRREHDAQLAGLFEKVEQHRIATDARLEAEYEPLRARMEQAVRPNYALMTSVISVIMAVVAGGWLIMGLKIDTAISPLALSVEQNKVALAAQSERVRVIDTATQANSESVQVSRQDRAQLNERVRMFEATQASRSQAIADVGNLKQQWQMVIDRLQTIRADATRQQAALIEIETQFCESDHLRNVFHAHDLRTTAMLWRKVFGENYPTDNTYYPIVCNRPGAVQANTP